MDELKTLRDIRSIWKCTCGELHAHADLDALKSEAVKWIKDISDYKKLSKAHPDIKQRLEQQRMNDGARLWIKHFFNITDAELK